MKNIPKVFGLIQAKNEWPPLALSISHALMHHVDEVYVLNHASLDRPKDCSIYRSCGKTGFTSLTGTMSSIGKRYLQTLLS